MKVLVADDDPVSRRLLETYLARWDYEATVATNGAEAWALFQKDDFPLVLTDWMMPEMDGVDLVRKIRASDRGTLCYAILVTSKSQKEDLVEGMEAGADDFVSKPFDRDELRVRLREGERTVRLERTLADQNLALREAQAALEEHKKRGQPSQASSGAREAAQLLIDIIAPLAMIRDDLDAGRNPPTKWISQGLTATLKQLEELDAVVQRWKSST